MRKFICLLIAALLLPCFSAAEDSGWANARLPKERMPEFIETVSWEDLPETNPGQHHYLLLCIDRWQSSPRPKDYPSTPLDQGRGADKFGFTDGMVILTLDTAAHRVMISNIIRDAAVLKPGSTDEKQYYGRITYIYNDFGAEALCRLISEHLGIKIEKYILFNFSQIQDIIDLECLDGVYVELTADEIDYLARYAVPRHTVIKADGYFPLKFADSTAVLQYVTAKGQALEFTIDSGHFRETDSGYVDSTVSVTGSCGSAITFEPKGNCSITLEDGTVEKGFYSFEHNRLEVMTGADVHLNRRAPAGLYHMKGHSALLYMRIRKAGKGDTDFMRTQRVRTVLSALADECRAFSLDEANALANSINEHQDTTNMNLQEIVEASGIAWTLRDCTIEEFRIPRQEDVRSITFGNMAAEEINWPSTRTKFAEFLDHTTLTRDIDYLVVDD